jgi:hypothetical protein
MHIGFDISQTGSGKAGCGYFAHAMVQAMIDVAPQNSYSLYPSFGDFYFDALMPVLNPYSGNMGLGISRVRRRARFGLKMMRKSR